MSIFDNISWGRFFDSLQYMWQGMLCIFIVIAVIIVSIMLLGNLTAKKPKDDLEKNQ
jgi:hypothetical protein